jgi:hypothetical protein
VYFLSSLSWHDWPIRVAFVIALLWIGAPDPGGAASLEEVALAKTANRQALLEEGKKKANCFGTRR